MSSNLFLLEAFWGSCFCKVTPALGANIRRASTKLTPSISIIKVITSPPLPELKQCQICFSGDTIKEGVFSRLKGDEAEKLAPTGLSWTYSFITSTISKRDFISSEICITFNIIFTLTKNSLQPSFFLIILLFFFSFLLCGRKNKLSQAL